MLVTEFATLCRSYTWTNSTTFPDATLKAYANAQMEQLANRIVEVSPDYWGRTLYRDLQAGIRKYSLPSDIISSISKVELKIDGSEWEDIDPMELSVQEYATDEDTIQSQFVGKPSRYAVFGQNLVIYSALPIIDVTSGIKFLCSLYPTPLANLTDVRDLAVPASDTQQWFPRQFHELLARKVGICYKQNKDRPIALTDFEQNVEADIERALNPLRKIVEALPATENVDNWYDY